MHIVQGRRLRALLISISAVAMLASACGTSARPANERGPIKVGATGSPHASPAASSSADAPRTPSPRYADPLDRYAYREAFGRCTTLGVAAIADAYGGTAANRASVAAAYAAHAYPQTTRFRQAATQGCLDGFSRRT